MKHNTRYTSTEQVEKIIVEKVRKSQLTASNLFEWNKICREQPEFVKCTMKEDGEAIIFSYNVHNLCQWTMVLVGNREQRLLALIDIGKLARRAKEYRFSLAPENLYFDVQGRVYVKERDVYSAEESFSEEEFISQYKSLIGSTLSKKYKFEDYINGGLDLLDEETFLCEVGKCTELSQLIDILHKEYHQYVEDERERLMIVSKSANRTQRILLVVLPIALVLCIAVLAYWLAWIRPYEQAVIAANEAYLRSDYGATVEAMESVDLDRMNLYQKYILAISCVKCESFNNESMANILNTISLNGDEKIMDYWILINRMETDAAADIAMQQSSNQLLYYAYLKEKALIESNTTITGQEKAELLSAVEGKLKSLEEEYQDLTEE